MKQELNYFEERNISQDAFISKVTDETAVESVNDFRYTLSKLAKYQKFVTFKDLLRFSNVLLIYKGTAYVSKYINIPDGIIDSKTFKKVLTKSLKNQRSILNFLRSGLIVLDINNFRIEYISGYNPMQNFFIFTDYDDYFPPVNEIAFLDEECNIPDELYIELFGKEAYLDQKEEEYLSLDEEYAYLYDE